MLEQIEKIIYVNLDHRLDRRAQIEQTLSCFPPEKVIRFPAIKEKHGGVGCTKSHIAVLKMAIQHQWKNYLVIEDDAMWNNQNGCQKIDELMSKSFDVITLGTVFAKYDKDTFKLHSGQTTTAYIVSQQYYQTLLQNFEEGLSGFLSTGQYHRYAIDQYWKHIQARDNWFCVIPSVFIQREGYSDIEKKHLNNGRYFS